jgi:hypothetical protein
MFCGVSTSGDNVTCEKGLSGWVCAVYTGIL